MSTSSWETLVQVGSQVPLVLIFIWFVLRIEKASKEEREQMRKVHKEERAEWISVLDRFSKEMQEISSQMTHLGASIGSHDSKITELTARLDDCLAVGAVPTDEKRK